MFIWRCCCSSAQWDAQHTKTKNLLPVTLNFTAHNAVAAKRRLASMHNCNTLEPTHPHIYTLKHTCTRTAAGAGFAWPGRIPALLLYPACDTPLSTGQSLAEGSAHLAGSTAPMRRLHIHKPPHTKPHTWTAKGWPAPQHLSWPGTTVSSAAGIYRTPA